MYIEMLRNIVKQKKHNGERNITEKMFGFSFNPEQEKTALSLPCFDAFSEICKERWATKKKEKKWNGTWKQMKINMPKAEI